MQAVLEEKPQDTTSGSEVCHAFKNKDIERHVATGDPVTAYCGYVSVGNGKVPVLNSTKARCPECEIFCNIEDGMRRS